MAKGALSELAVVGTELNVRVTPRARRCEVTCVEGELAVRVSAPPEDGKANAAATAAVARALGVAKSRVVSVRGAASRNKVFRLE